MNKSIVSHALAEQLRLVMVDVLSVQLSEDHASNLKLFGSFFLSLSVTLSLGSVTSHATESRNFSALASWEPPERREFQWSNKERWLRCHVHDEQITGGLQLA